MPQLFQRLQLHLEGFGEAGFGEARADTDPHAACCQLDEGIAAGRIEPVEQSRHLGGRFGTAEALQGGDGIAEGQGRVAGRVRRPEQGAGLG